jgi:hypothetical protein
MANPSTNFELTPYSGESLENTRLTFRELYLHQVYGDNPNQLTVIEVDPITSGLGDLGQTAVNDWVIKDGPSDAANVVAHAQGLHTNAGNWFNAFIMVFVNERYAPTYILLF